MMLRNRLKHRESLFVVVVILILLAAVPILTYPMGRDQGMYANIGRTILAGGIPYIDMWDIKPPPIYYIYAVGIQLFGDTTVGIRAIDLMLIPIGMLGLYLVGQQIENKRLGLLATVVYAVFYFNEDFQNLTQSDSLITVLLIWAVYCAVRASSQNNASGWRSIIWGLLTGALCGLILWFKQYYVFFVFALILNHLIALHDKRNLATKTVLKDSSAFVFGGLLTGGTLLLLFWSQGMIREMLIIAEGTAAYNAQGSDFATFVANMGHYLYFRWLTWHVLLILIVLWWIFTIIGCFRVRFVKNLDNRGDHHKKWRIIVLWFFATLAFAFIQAKGFDTHWIPTLPAMALMGASVIYTIINYIVHIIGRKHDSRTFTFALYCIVTVALLTITVNTTWGRAWRFMTGQESQEAYWDTFQANDLKSEQSLLVADYLQNRVVPNDSLYIWGFRPEVYFMAKLRPATRYQAHFPLVAPWYPEDWKQNNVDILWAAMPPYVLILEDDYMPWVTDYDADSHTLLQDYTELNNWLIANYTKAEQIGDFIIWKRME